MKTSRVFDFFFVAFLIIGLGLAAFNRQAIRDWWTLRSYHPSVEVSTLATDAGMSQRGRNLFYVSDPQFVTTDEMSKACAPENLGCITASGQIFLLKVGKYESQDDLIVTAAHEMLHQAYRRMSAGNKLVVDKEATNYLDSSDHDALKKEMAEYTDPIERADELHSILGSEISDLPVALTQHYDQYFSDRSLSTKAYDRTQL